MSANTPNTDKVGSPAALVSEEEAQGVRQDQPAVSDPKAPMKVDEMEDAVLVHRVNDSAAPEAHAPLLEAGASWIPINEVNAGTSSNEGTNDGAAADYVPKGSTMDLSVPNVDLGSNADPTSDNSDATENFQGPQSDVEAATSLIPNSRSLQQVSRSPPAPKSCSDHRNTSRLLSNASLSPPCTRASGSS
jgi:hypothetical protein